MTNKLLEYFKGDELASNVFKSKYAQEGDVTPDDMHKRMAKEFARIEYKYQYDLNQHVGRLKPPIWNNLSLYGRHRDELDEDVIYDLFKDFKYIVPQGSIMSNLGNKAVTSLSNCFVVGQPTDSYGGICKKDEEMAQLMKRRGGVGLDISTLRPATTKVSNAAKSSTGAVSFMHRFSNTTREVAQDGRRGALMLSIDINHPDVLEFIKIKRDLSQVTGANISIKLNKEFMEAVEKDEDYILRFPCETKWEDVALACPHDFKGGKKDLLDYNELTSTIDNVYVKKIKAREYWDEIIKSAHGVAEPGLMFWDNMIDYSPDGVYTDYQAVTTNPCFSFETKILTAYGYKEIGSLEGQDVEFINKDGQIVQGTVFKSGEKATYTLTLSNKEIIVTTVDHRFMLTDGSEKQAQFITKEDRLMPFFKINDSLSEYVKYGFIQGDGCTGRLESDAHLGLEVNIGKKDQDIAKLFGVCEGKCYLGGYNEILKLLGFNSSPLPERTLPTTFNSWKKEDKLMFLKGLWSANGSIIKNHRISFKSTCHSLIIELQNVLKEFEIDSYYTTNKAKEVKFSNGTYLCKESYDLNITKFDSVLKFAEFIGFVHDYKKESLKELILIKAPKVISKKSTEVKDVFDFTLYDDTHWGVIQGIIAHNCSEIGMQPYDACRLIAVNLFGFVDNPFTPEAKFDFEKFYKINYEAMRLSDDLIDLELEHIDRILRKIAEDPEPFEDKRTEFELWEKIKKTAASSRRTGLGFTALGDTLAALGLKYDSDKALEVIEQIMSKKMESELDCTIDLAILRGTFDGWDTFKEFEHWQQGGDRYEGKNNFYKTLIEKFPIQTRRMIEYGRRNVSWSTVAPTGTVSIMTQTTSGIEPLFMPYYMRRKKINPGEAGVRVDFVDEVGDSWQEFPVLHPKFKSWLYKNVEWDFKTDEEPGFEKALRNISKEELQKLFEKSPWYGSTANDIDWVKRVEIQGIIQKYITHSISSTINLPESVSLEAVSEIYKESWKKGLKGITVYRDGSRSGVLVSESTKDKQTFEQKDAPKRPSELPCEIHHPTIKNTKYTVIVGLLDSKPYEVFAIPYEVVKGYKNGFLSKTKSGVYNLIASLDEKSTIHTNLTGDMSDTEAALTRLISTSLRHGAEIKFIVEQLNKTHGDLFSFSKIIARVLKKYIPEGAKSTVKCQDCGSENVIFQEGCQTCQSCGSSKCG